MLGIELVEDQEERRPLEVARAVSQACLDRGLLVYPGGHYANVIGLLPPLIVTEAQLETATQRIVDGIGHVIP